MRGESPEAHVFHSALCLERAPRRLSPWKQNRGGGGRQSEAELGPEWGEGRWGSWAVALVTELRRPSASSGSWTVSQYPPMFRVWPPSPDPVLSLVSLSSVLISSLRPHSPLF